MKVYFLPNAGGAAIKQREGTGHKRNLFGHGVNIYLVHVEHSTKISAAYSTDRYIFPLPFERHDSADDLGVADDLLSRL